MGFQSDFVWGAATASYQIEGAAYEGGKGRSVWDTACENGHFVFDKHTARVGCDHYHRFREDVALMKQMGLKAYRFSVNWPRLLPHGTGEVNPDGVRFYNELIDELLKAGIEPYLTVFHWEYPYELFLKGGWLNPDSPKWFAEYAGKVSELFSDRVKYFSTVNEPQCFIGCGLYKAEHAPFLVYPPEEALLAWHNALKGNGLAVRAIREKAKQPVKVGFTVATDVLMPRSEEETEFALRESFVLRGDNFFNNALFTDPAILGKYPENLAKEFGANFTYDPADLEIIKCDPDFLGLNIYHAGCRCTTPICAGRSAPRASITAPRPSMNAIICPSTSRKTAWRSPSGPLWTAPCTTLRASNICGSILRSSSARPKKASM